LEELVHSRGHILLMSPKGHPELAGKGVEYAWGAAKLLFRKINDLDIDIPHTGAPARTAVRSTQAALDRRDRAAEAPTYSGWVLGD